MGMRFSPIFRKYSVQGFFYINGHHFHFANILTDLHAEQVTAFFCMTDVMDANV